MASGGRDKRAGPGLHLQDSVPAERLELQLKGLSTPWAASIQKLSADKLQQDDRASEREKGINQVIYF